jgi:hypothetical protein
MPNRRKAHGWLRSNGFEPVRSPTNHRTIRCYRKPGFTAVVRKAATEGKATIEVRVFADVD